MNNKTKFYKLLNKAQYDEKSLTFIIDKIMPLINSYSFCKGKIDEDLKSELIEYSISLIKTEGFADKLANYKKN